ncbi:MAG: NUDIX hydrolase [Clostridia bacterium]|nr:NUDIX hydrolase [Clostridia bacterium]MBQ9988988.1 NUDIX hydrolase [Clostridia bacterium]
METENNNWGQSVTGVLIRDNKVLLGRHTYGSGQGRLIIPGGYVKNDESPQEAVKREFLEEVNVVIEPKEIIGVRFNMRDWYIAFAVDYVSGEAQSDNNENSEVLWVDVDEALERDDVPELTKKLVRCALHRENGFKSIPYNGRHTPCSLYGVE